MQLQRWERQLLSCNRHVRSISFTNCEIVDWLCFLYPRFKFYWMVFAVRWSVWTYLESCPRSWSNCPSSQECSECPHYTRLSCFFGKTNIYSLVLQWSYWQLHQRHNTRRVGSTAVHPDHVCYLFWCASFNYSICSSCHMLWPNCVCRSLSMNRLYGPFPYQLGNLSTLLQLYVPAHVHWIHSVGSIFLKETFYEICRVLEANQLSGRIPSAIRNLTKLERL